LYYVVSFFTLSQRRWSLNTSLTVYKSLHICKIKKRNVFFVWKPEKYCTMLSNVNNEMSCELMYLIREVCQLCCATRKVLWFQQGRHIVHLFFILLIQSCFSQNLALIEHKTGLNNQVSNANSGEPLFFILQNWTRHRSWVRNYCRLYQHMWHHRVSRHTSSYRLLP
jgi:hypothetical protein